MQRRVRDRLLGYTFSMRCPVLNSRVVDPDRGAAPGGGAMLSLKDSSSLGGENVLQRVWVGESAREAYTRYPKREAKPDTKTTNSYP
eukprot:3436442-Rhodomonas_salina.1